LTPRLIKKTAFRFVIDAASHQKDLVLSSYEMMTASHFMIDAASHQKDLVESKFL